MPTLEIREYTPARLHSLNAYLATSDPELLERVKKAYESYMSAIVEVPPRPAGGMPPAKAIAGRPVAKTAPALAP